MNATVVHSQTNAGDMIPIEETFQSKGRIKILRLLARVGELNISAIAQQTQLNHKSTHNHLKCLVQANLVEKKEFGRIRIYRFKNEHPKGRALMHLFDLWENSTL